MLASNFLGVILKGHGAPSKDLGDPNLELQLILIQSDIVLFSTCLAQGFNSRAISHATALMTATLKHYSYNFYMAAGGKEFSRKIKQIPENE